MPLKTAQTWILLVDSRKDFEVLGYTGPAKIVKDVIDTLNVWLGRDT
jgi:hypothetical protein